MCRQALAGLLTMTLPDKPSSPKQKYQTVPVVADSKGE
ncbi:Fic family protein [Thiomicrospira aerophila]